LLCAVLWSGICAGWRAEAAPISARDIRVLLVVDRASDPIIERIRAEVNALGLTIVARPPSGALEADARAQKAAAAIRALPSRNGVELWMADVTTGRTLTRQLVIDETPGGPDYNLIALQTAEILRTSLFRHEDKTPPPAPQPMVATAPPSQPSPALPAMHIEGTASAGTLFSLGGVGPSLQAWLSLGLRSPRGYLLSVDASAPIARGSLSGPEGSALVSAYLAGLRLSKGFIRDQSNWDLRAGAGVGALYLRIVGEPDLSLTERDVSTLLGYAYGTVDAGWKPSESTRIGATLMLATTVKGTDVRFAGNQAGTFGKLILGAAVGLTAIFD
jgi:hypothetical protein